MLWWGLLSVDISDSMQKYISMQMSFVCLYWSVGTKVDGGGKEFWVTWLGMCNFNQIVVCWTLGVQCHVAFIAYILQCIISILFHFNLCIYYSVFYCCTVVFCTLWCPCAVGEEPPASILMYEMVITYFVIFRTNQPWNAEPDQQFKESQRTAESRSSALQTKVARICRRNNQGTKLSCYWICCRSVIK